MADDIVAAVPQESTADAKEGASGNKAEGEDVKSKEPLKHLGIPEAVFVVR